MKSSKSLLTIALGAVITLMVSCAASSDTAKATTTGPPPDIRETPVVEGKALTTLPTAAVFTHIPSAPLDTFIKSVEVVSGGGSGYPFFIVVDVDPAKIGSYQVKSTDPYWLKYYMRMWWGGHHASYFGPQALPNPWGVYWMQQFFNANGAYLNNAPFTSANTYNWEFLSQKLNRGTANAPLWYFYPNYFPSCFQAASGRLYVPTSVVNFDGTAMDTTEFMQYSTTAGPAGYQIYPRFRIYTGETETAIWNPTPVPRICTAGEVESDGWGILPFSGTEGSFTLPGQPGTLYYLNSTWVILKPYNKPLYFTNTPGQPWFSINQTSGASAMAPIQWAGVTAPTMAAAWSAAMNNYLNMGIAGLNNATFNADLKQASMSFGGVSTPDYKENGNFYIVNGSKDASSNVVTNVKILPASLALSYIKAYQNVSVNGSANSLKDALGNAAEISAANGGKPIVLCYMAQDLEYGAANETQIRTSLSIINSATAAGYNVSVTAHSWSGHIALDMFGTNPKVTLNLVNPAQGEFPAGGSAKFDSQLQYAKATVNLFCGTLDKISVVGAGCDQKAINACVDNVNGKCTVTYVNGAGHSMEEMLEEGADLSLE